MRLLIRIEEKFYFMKRIRIRENISSSQEAGNLQLTMFAARSSEELLTVASALSIP
jgi:hypothetical protein